MHQDKDEVQAYLPRYSFFRRGVGFLLAVFGLMAGWAGAGPVTQEQAAKAVRAYLSQSPTPLGAKMAGKTRQARTFNRAGQDTPLFYVVALEGGGFVVTSADTGVSPIIAISESGDFAESEESALWVLLNRDLPQRMDAAAKGGGLAVQPKMAAGAAPDEGGAPSAEQQWASLLAEQSKAHVGPASVSDVRVEPLVQSKWDQSTVWTSTGAKNVYNYYTPNNYVCGCVATAGAQVMRFHEYPADADALTYSCWVNGPAKNLTMKGGPYSWADMPYDPPYTISDLEREAIGRLTYDVGVAARMDYKTTQAGGSGAYNFVMVDGLKAAFGYASGFTHLLLPGTSSPAANATIRNALLGTLDAGLPAVLGISGNGGHSIVADGYGYELATLYVHLNLGWSGSQDAWYNMSTLDVSSYFHFTLFDDVSFNIHPTEAGEYITGRTLDSQGVVLPGLTVTASNTVNGAIHTAVSNAKGIYVVKVPSASATYEVTAESGSLLPLFTTSVSVQASAMCDYSLGVQSSTDISISSYGQVGNRWGNDLTLLSPDEARAHTRSIGEALNNTALKWQHSGNAPWFAQAAVTHDGVSALRSGAIEGLQHSAVQATVTGPGTLSFWWRVSSENNYDWLRFYIDGTEQPGKISGSPPWAQKTLTVAAGTHTLKWAYEKDPYVENDSDCGWLDEVVWTPDGFATATNGMSTAICYVPNSWLTEMYPGYNGNYDALASSTGFNGYFVWESFVAGLAPTNAASTFTITNLTVNAADNVTFDWTPRRPDRTYTVWGKTNLTDKAWHCPTNAAMRFFKVSVEL